MIDEKVKKEGRAVPQMADTASTASKTDGAARATPRQKKKGHGLSGPWMYVGPTAPGIGIQNRVYTEIPAGAQERIEQMPEIGHLFIPVKDYPMANRMLREGTGYISDAYCKVSGIERGGSRT